MKVQPIIKPLWKTDPRESARLEKLRRESHAVNSDYTIPFFEQLRERFENERKESKCL